MKPAAKIVGIVIAVLIIVAIALPLLVNVNSFRPEIESRLGAALGRQVKVGNLGLSLLSGGVRADDFSSPTTRNSATLLSSRPNLSKWASS